jgi:hypothetical protein
MAQPWLPIPPSMAEGLKILTFPGYTFDQDCTWESVEEHLSAHCHKVFEHDQKDEKHVVVAYGENGKLAIVETLVQLFEYRQQFGVRIDQFFRVTEGLWEQWLPAIPKDTFIELTLRQKAA